MRPNYNKRSPLIIRSYRDSMDFRSRLQSESGDNRLSVEPNDGFDCQKLTEEEKDSLYGKVLFDEENDPGILSEAVYAELTVQPTRYFQHEVKPENNSDSYVPIELPLNAADLLDENPTEMEIFDYYNLPEVKMEPIDQDDMLEDVKNPVIHLETDSAEYFSPAFENLQNQMKIEVDFDDDDLYEDLMSGEGEDFDDEWERHGSDDEEESGSDEKKPAQNREKRRRYVARSVFACPVKNCPFSSPNFKKFEEHMKDHTGQQEFFCDACKKTFSSENDALRHIQERLKKECCACGRKCSTVSNLGLHLRCHTEEKPFVCKICRKGYSRQGHLNIHLLTHTGEKAFICGICKRGFALKNTLEKHELTHTEEKAYKCKNCDYRCNNSSCLTRHNRIHTGDKPYVCRYCEKRFSQRNSLKNHEFIHTGEKPFECDQCGRRFNRKAHLNEHILKHTEEKPFTCKNCDAKFAHSDSLNRHLRKKHPS